MQEFIIFYMNSWLKFVGAADYGITSPKNINKWLLLKCHCIFMVASLVIMVLHHAPLYMVLQHYVYYIIHFLMYFQQTNTSTKNKKINIQNYKTQQLGYTHAHVPRMYKSFQVWQMYWTLNPNFKTLFTACNVNQWRMKLVCNVLCTHCTCIFTIIDQNL